MKFKELNEADINLITTTYYDKDNGPWEKRAASLGVHFNVSERTIRKWVSEKLKLKEKTDVESEQYLIAKKRTHDTSKKIKFISWAQNNTPVHKKLLKKMEMYRDFLNADIHIIAGRYRNPTSIWTNKNQENEFWYEEVLPYLDANRHDIHKFVSILSDIKIQPTAINPMSGFHSISGVNSCVIGAPKVQMEMIPVLEGQRPKMMLTTGAVTKQNYTDGKAGKIGEFHHTFGFVIVEINDDETFHIRQVTADDKTGDFTDLFYKVDGTGVHRIDEIEAIVLGDLHYGNHDQTVLDSTMKMLTKIKPKHVILHDVFDGFSINHHEMKDPFIQYQKEVQGTNDLNKEIGVMIDGLKAFENFENVVIVRSNHDDFLDRWLKNEDWKKQPTSKNSRLYMHFSGMLLDQYASTEPVKGVIPTVINEVYPNYITLGRNTSYKVLDWEVGQHGDEGSNGSRGSLLQFRKLNTKIIVGHYHSPGRKDGAIAVGTSTIMRMGYNRGASSWLQSHVIIHKDGRAQHVNFIRDKDNNVGFTTM